MTSFAIFVSKYGTFSRSLICIKWLIPLLLLLLVASLVHQPLRLHYSTVTLQNKCTETCCFEIIPIEFGYSGEKQRVPALHDRFSCGSIKTLGDVLFGTLPKPKWIVEMMQPLLQDLDVNCLQNGTVVTVESAHLDEFLSKVHPKIPVQYIGISCDSDSGFEPRHIPLLQSEKVLHWFGCNCHIPMSRLINEDILTQKKNAKCWSGPPTCGGVSPPETLPAISS